MKKVWKVLAAAAAVAALTPYRISKDEETGTTTVKALMWKATKSPNPEDGGTKVDVGLNLLPDIPGLLGRGKEEEPMDDDGIDIEIDIAPEQPEAEMFDDSVLLAGAEPAAPKAEVPAPEPLLEDE